MIQLDAIRNFYPEPLRHQAVFQKYLLKEYLQLMILDYLSSTPYIRKLSFIGGTSIRLIKGIDRFSEDLDFDCKGFTKEDFLEMTDGVIRFLQHNGLRVRVKDRESPGLKAFRRNIHFPELLFDLGLTGHREERFLIKIESEDQQIHYEPVMANIKGGGFFFPMPVPGDGVLCAMKVAAMLERQKGRDFYDAMFLLSQTLPDFDFLRQAAGIPNLEFLKQEAERVIENVDLKTKTRDFEHLLFNKNNSQRILRVGEFFREL